MYQPIGVSIGASGLVPTAQPFQPSNNVFVKTNTKEKPSFVRDSEKNGAKPPYETYQVKNKVLEEFETILPQNLNSDSNPFELSKIDVSNVKLFTPT